MRGVDQSMDSQQAGFELSHVTVIKVDIISAAIPYVVDSGSTVSVRSCMAAGVDLGVLGDEIGAKPGDRNETAVEQNKRASPLLEDSEGNKEGSVSDPEASHASLEERRADVDRALAWLKGEMVNEKRVTLIALARLTAEAVVGGH